MTRFSLVVPCIGRVDETARLLDSLGRQTFRDFEVILVDQSAGEQLALLAAQYAGKFTLRHLKVQTVGASRARNAGLALAQGDMVLFPDDDAWLPPTLLERAHGVFTAHPEIDAAIGVLIDARGKPHDRFAPTAPCPAGLMDAFTRSAEPVLCFRRAALARLGGFDPLLGTGAVLDTGQPTPWGAGEGADLCVRALRQGLRLRLDPTLTVYHARITIQPGDARETAKARAYARGMGYVVRKNHLPGLFVAGYVFTYLRALAWNALRGRWADVKYHWERVRGLGEGIINVI